MQSSLKHQKPDRRNPFYEEPLHKAFYHPSRNIHIETESAPVENGDDVEIKLSPSSKRFLKAGNLFTSKSPPTGFSPVDISSKFDESWPTSERPSTVDIPDYASPGSVMGKLDTDKGSLALLLKDKPWLAALMKSDPIKNKLDFEMQPERDSEDTEVQKKSSKESTLSKYVDRFRHGTPMSRDERQKKKATDPRDFWWLQSPPRGGAGTPADSSTPIDESEKQTKTSKASRLKNSKVRESYDEDTRMLQSKADLLLESASSLNSSDPIVSTVGLGSESDSMHYSSSFSEKPYRPEFIKKQIEKDPLSVRRSKKPLNPDEDILTQWRMMRRRELAQVGLKPATTGPAASVLQQSTTRVSKPHISTGLDSKLEEFRGHLTRATHGVFEQPISSRLTTTEVGGEMESGRTETDKTSNVVKEEKVTETACQTSPPESTSSSPTETAVPPEKYGTLGPSGGKHVIASPALKYKLKSTRERIVEPHYHLSCDVIPWQPDKHESCDCWHEHHHGHRERDTTHELGKKQKEHRKSKHEESDFDSDYEIYKHRHMQRLQRELSRERDSGIRYRHIHGHGHEQDEDQSRNKYEKPERDKPRPRDKNDVESEETDGESGVTLSMEDLKLTRKNAGQRGMDKRQISEIKSENSSSDKESLGSDDRRKRRERRNEDKETNYDERKSKRTKSKEVVPQRSRSPTKFRDRQKEKVKEKRNMSPVKHDAVDTSARGSRVGIGSTIGQVITDRLFAGSPLSVRASVESETSLRFPPSPTADADALLCSDEEEYINDEILKDLRAKRHMYVKRLQAIEALLQEKSRPTEGDI